MLLLDPLDLFAGVAQLVVSPLVAVELAPAAVVPLAVVQRSASHPVEVLALTVAVQRSAALGCMWSQVLQFAVVLVAVAATVAAVVLVLALLLAVRPVVLVVRPVVLVVRP